MIIGVRVRGAGKNKDPASIRPSVAEIDLRPTKAATEGSSQIAGRGEFFKA